MAATTASVLQIAPEFASLGSGTPSQIDGFITLAVAQCNAGAFFSPAIYDLAVSYLTAHMIAEAHPELYAGGVVQSESVGGVSVSYAVPTPQITSALETTRFGRQYRRILISQGLGIGVI